MNKCVLIVLVLTTYSHCVRLPGKSRLDELRLQVLSEAEHAFDNLHHNNEVVETDRDIQLLIIFQQISKELDDFKPDTSGILLDSLWTWARASYEIENIENYHQTFMRFQRQNIREDGGIKKPQVAWTDLAETFLQKTDDSITNSIDKLNQIATANDDNLFQIVLKDASGNMCHLEHSPQQTIFNLHNAVALAELKGHAMRLFSYMLLELYGKGNFTMEKELQRQDYEDKTIRKIAAAKEAMERASRVYYKCDPRTFVEGENYERITKLLQGFIENEVNLNTEGTCRETCSKYEHTKVEGCYMDQFCAKQPPCRGNVVQCEYFDSDMTICKADPSSDRRYEYIEYENGRVLGQMKYCPWKRQCKVDSWWRYLFWHCSYCFCYCDDPTNSDRFFNLRPVVSNIESNRVVTGVRFAKVNRIIHLQIQEGDLLKYGQVNTSTLKWKPVDHYEIDNHDVAADIDYHQLSWEESEIDLDELQGPKGHCLTGFRFRKVGPDLNMEIRVTPVNITTGTLSVESSYWMGNDNTPVSGSNARALLSLHHPDIPTRSGNNKKDSKHNQYLKFQGTDPDFDAGQNTVPFIDTQELKSTTILSGAGIAHRGKVNSGGFITPLIIDYEFCDHMKAEFPVHNDKEEIA